jgi:hypothetical protein
VIRITHPRPQQGRQSALGVEFVDGSAAVENLHPEREQALIQHGFTIASDGVPLDSFTVAVLRDIADVEGIDLPAKAKKADIIAAIVAAGLEVM